MYLYTNTYMSTIKLMIKKGKNYLKAIGGSYTGGFKEKKRKERNVIKIQF